ncbi:MAG: PPC domain-containing protein, partial [Planctomycetota bacterium]
DDSPLTKQDSYFTVILPKDGTYYVTIRESSFRGNQASHYRMHIGNFPRPAAVYPAGGRPGDKLKLQFVDPFAVGQPVRAFEKEVQLPDDPGFRPGLFCRDESGASPTPMPFRFSDMPNYLEVEPNNNFQSIPADSNPVTLPHAINGIIQEPGDFDYHKFTCKKGEVWHVECFARRLGSGLDPVVNIFSADRKSIVGNDDGRKPDSYIRFQSPADGDYYVRVYDHLRRGQPDFVYRIEFEKAKPELTLGINRIDRYSQQRQTIAVPQGNRFAVLVNAKRKDFGGTIELLGDSLPENISLHAKPMLSNLNVMPVVFEATKDAPIGGQLIEFQGQYQPNEQNKVKGGFENFADFVLGQPNNAVYYGCTVDKLAVAVVEKLPFELQIVQPNSPLVRNGTKYIKVVAKRAEGFEDQINIQFPFRTPGVGTTYQISMPKGKSEVLYPLNANGNAQVGKFPMYVIGTSNFKGPAWCSSQLAEIEVAEPFVTAKIARMSILPGESTQLICKFDQLRPFEGEAIAEIKGVPANITVDSKKTFNKETAELVFNISTTDKSPIGKHGGLFCEVSIPVNGEQVVSRAGNAVLQINKPKPPKKTPIAENAKPKGSNSAKTSSK